MTRGRVILVDGSNVRRSAWPNPAPSRLVAALDAWAGEDGDADDHELVVVFDGSSGATSTPRVAVVEVPYADDELVAIAREVIAAGWTVDAATSDRELRTRLQDAGAAVVWGGGRFLGEIGLAR